MKKLSILIADDSPEICSLVSNWLRMHNTACAHDGAEALSAVSLLHFDLVITDILMPKIGGLDVIRQVKQSQPWVRILAITGGGRFINSTDCVAQAKTLGADDVLLKPFDEVQLKNAVQHLTTLDELESLSKIGSAH